jgi:Muconolactone delta-isomerase.
MQFLGIAKPRPELLEATPQDFQAIGIQEAVHAKASYMSGTLRHLWRDGNQGAVAIFEAASLEEMRIIAANFPLMRAGYYEFELIPLLPYGGLLEKGSA